MVVKKYWYQYARNKKQVPISRALSPFREVSEDREKDLETVERSILFRLKANP